jgi:hypothetical protein
MIIAHAMIMFLFSTGPSKTERNPNVSRVGVRDYYFILYLDLAGGFDC